MASHLTTCCTEGLRQRNNALGLNTIPHNWKNLRMGREGYHFCYKPPQDRDSGMMACHYNVVGRSGFACQGNP